MLESKTDQSMIQQTLFQNDLKPRGMGHKDEIACNDGENRDRSPTEQWIANC